MNLTPGETQNYSGGITVGRRGRDQCPQPFSDIEGAESRVAREHQNVEPTIPFQTNICQNQGTVQRRRFSCWRSLQSLGRVYRYAVGKSAQKQPTRCREIASWLVNFCKAMLYFQCRVDMALNVNILWMVVKSARSTK